MATTILMKHPKTGVVKKGLYGFSWTTLFFGGFPALIRGDILVGVAVMVASLCTMGLAGIIWAFIYNKRYTIKLIEQGYELSGSEGENTLARTKLGIEKIDEVSGSMAAPVVTTATVGTATGVNEAGPEDK